MAFYSLYWCDNQTMWGGGYSRSFRVTNGVRQGGILSLYHFNIYVDDLSVQLNACRVGCSNHPMSADDLVIMSLSAAGLTKLLRIYQSYRASHDI